MDPVKESFDSRREEALDNHSKLMRTSSRKTGARTEAKPMAVISATGSERKPWTMEHTWEEGGDRKLGRKGSRWA